MPNRTQVNIAGGGRSTLTVNVALSGQEGQKAPSVRAYLFDRAGRLIDSHAATQSIRFKVDPQQDGLAETCPPNSRVKKIAFQERPRMRA